ncbi:hypothetical protein EXIGLDRAFT_776168 [Exidia glandulosa HHB12029]|uniref:Uncharacterized protein n=1 Tax=Exidia glandulosa HHB12029 TaxID=1314781 RepID=A0A165ZPZ4_EXIGL|nr:hypothetical protein EXIGLDRAFT_776168 [Exidia glandulosa HHB12029]
MAQDVVLRSFHLSSAQLSILALSMSVFSRIALDNASNDAEWDEIALMVRNAVDSEAPPRYTIPQRRAEPTVEQDPPEGYQRVFYAADAPGPCDVEFRPAPPPPSPTSDPCTPPLKPRSNDDDSDDSAGALLVANNATATANKAAAEVSTQRLDLANVMMIFAWIAVNFAHVARVLRTMDAGDYEALTRVFSLFYPRFPPPYRLPPIKSILKCATHMYGLDYEVKFDNGTVSWVRDSDLWRSVNGRLMVSLYWTSNPRVFPPSVIDDLLRLPQYSAEGGAFLRTMKRKVVFGSRRDADSPRLGYAFV